MAQLLQIDPALFQEAPNLASVAAPVAALPVAVAPVAVAPPPAASLPAWYRTPVAAIPIAAATFIIGNVLLMIPWQAL
jgi:hypothetical protein